MCWYIYTYISNNEAWHGDTDSEVRVIYGFIQHIYPIKHMGEIFL